MKIVLIGPPGSGKGSQAKLIQKAFNIPHISTGNIFRVMMHEDTPLGREIYKYMSQALLVPDNLVIEVMQEYLKRDELRKDLLLDGFPRTLEQAIELDKIIDIDFAVLLDTDLDVVKERVLTRRICSNCGEVYNTVTYDKTYCNVCDAELKARKDDKEDIIKLRFSEYETLTKPVIEYYEKQGKLKHINGDQPIKVIFETIKKMISSGL
jgi:adenylate kinase